MVFLTENREYLLTRNDAQRRRFLSAMEAEMVLPAWIAAPDDNREMRTLEVLLYSMAEETESGMISRSAIRAGLNRIFGGRTVRDIAAGLRERRALRWDYLGAAHPLRESRSTS